MNYRHFILIALVTISLTSSLNAQKYAEQVAITDKVAEAPQYLPSQFIGTFSGKLETIQLNKPNRQFNANVQLSIYPTSINAIKPTNLTPKNRYKSPYLRNNSVYQFTLIYTVNGNKEFRNYTLHVIDSTKGTGFLDEQNGILIPYSIHKNKLILHFNLHPYNYNTIKVYTFSKLMVNEETFSGSKSFQSGDTTIQNSNPQDPETTMLDSIPLVSSMILSTYQSATLIRETEPTVTLGNLHQYGYFPSKYTNPHRVAVWVPKNYQPYSNTPVIYMHDGQMLFDSASTWNHQEWGMDELLSGRNTKAIVVGIWNDGINRSGDYFPQEVWENHLTQADKDSILTVTKGLVPLFGSEAKANSDNYLKFLVKELKPFIDTMYRPATNPENTHIAGASMGGLISWYALCEYPEVFGSAICLSTHWPGTSHLKYQNTPKAFENYLSKNLPSSKNHKIFFAHGTGYLDSLYVEPQKRIDQLMKKKGYIQNKNWKTMVYVGADHKESEWQKQMVDALNFVLPETKKSKK